MNFKQLKQLLTEENAVSPVIGVILMVAITVILAAVIGTFVLGLGDNVQNSAPQANFQFQYGATTVDITHNGGEDLEASSLSIAESDTTNTLVVNPAAGSTITTGELVVDSGTYDAGETIRIVWSSPAGGSSNTIGSSTAPN